MLLQVVQVTHGCKNLKVSGILNRNFGAVTAGGNGKNRPNSSEMIVGSAFSQSRQPPYCQLKRNNVSFEKQKGYAWSERTELPCTYWWKVTIFPFSAQFTRNFTKWKKTALSFREILFQTKKVSLIPTFSRPDHGTRTESARLSTGKGDNLPQSGPFYTSLGLDSVHH